MLKLWSINKGHKGIEKILSMNKKKFTKEEQNIKKWPESLVTTTFFKKDK